MGAGGADISAVERGRVGKEWEGGRVGSDRGSRRGFRKVGDQRVYGVRR